MKATKDFLRFRQHIRTLKLSVQEQYLMELFFEYHNCEYGYAYPKFNDLLVAFNTTSKNVVSRAIKLLEDKKLITVDREHKNNRYSIIGVESFINVVKEAVKTVKEAVKKTVKAVVKEVKEVVAPAKAEVKEDSENVALVKSYFPNVSMKDSKVIEGVSKAEIISALEDIKQAGQVAFNFAYVINRIKMIKNRKNTEVKSYGKETPLKFNNFEPRVYDYDRLEKQLLGWEEVTSLTDLTTSNGADHNAVDLEGAYEMSTRNLIEQLDNM